jgi:amidase
MPVLVKDNLDTADGMATTAGSLALLGSRPAADATVVARLRAAGAVVVGKTNLSEWANIRGTNSPSGWSARGGLTLNPHALDRSAGGSSSGSGAAAAAGLAAATIGTETDGSIICPAALCGVVGVKPTVGLTSRAGVVPISRSQDTVGPMTRTVRDAALVLTAIAGPDPRDPAPDVPVGVDYVAALTERLEGLRIGVPRATYWGKHAKLDAEIERALGVLSQLGAEVVDGTDVVTAAEIDESPDEMTVLLYELNAGMADYLATRIGDGPRSIADIVAFNRDHAAEELRWFGQDRFETAAEKGPLTSPEYVEALTTGRRRARELGIDATLRQHRLDALVAPALDPAWKSDLVNGDPHGLTSCTSVSAVAGYPIVTVPAGWVDDLPVGLGVMGTAWSEPTLLRIAFAYEQATSWWRPPAYRPPVAGR